MKKIFISHSSKDKDVCEKLVCFLCNCGVSKEDIFCTSVDDCGIEQSDFMSEIVSSVTTSKLNIIVLSKNYRKSQSCQNEAGIIYYLNKQKGKKIFLLSLKNFRRNTMKGFVNEKVFQFRRLEDKRTLTTLGKSVSRVLGKKYEEEKIKKNSEDMIMQLKAK